MGKMLNPGSVTNNTTSFSSCDVICIREREPSGHEPAMQQIANSSTNFTLLSMNVNIWCDKLWRMRPNFLSHILWQVVCTGVHWTSFYPTIVSESN